MSPSSLARVSLMFRCFGPLASAVINGRLMSVSMEPESSIFAFSAASFRTLEGHLIVSQINALIFSEFIGQIIHQTQVKIFSAQVGISVGRLDFENTPFSDLQDGDIESAAAQIENSDFFFAFFIESVGQGCRSGLIDDSLDIETGDFSGILGCLPLTVVKIGGYGDDRIRDFFTQVVFCGFLDIG